MSVFYLIEVTRIEVVQETYKDHILVSEKPTEHRRDKEYGSGSDPVMDREWEIVEKVRNSETTSKIFAQTVEADKFDLGRVVMAVNKFGLP